MISAVENIYNIMENVHLRLFFYTKAVLQNQSGDLKLIWNKNCLEDKIRFDSQNTLFN